jgi:hypothetical protein
MRVKRKSVQLAVVISLAACCRRQVGMFMRVSEEGSNSDL